VADAVVLNIRELGKVGTWPPDVRRIDRRTPYGNPFRLDDPWLTWVSVALGYRADAPGRRVAALALYRAWMTGDPIVQGAHEGGQGGSIEFTSGRIVTMTDHVEGLARAFSSLYPAPVLPPVPDLEPLRGFRLACWDAPLACHGDVIAEILYGLPCPDCGLRARDVEQLGHHRALSHGIDDGWDARMGLRG
jgi:hypothetical protein